MSPRTLSIKEMMVELDRHNERIRNRALALEDPTAFSEADYLDLFLDPGRPWGETDTPEEAALKQNHAQAMAEKAQREAAEPTPLQRKMNGILQRRGMPLPVERPKPVRTEDTAATRVLSDGQEMHVMPTIDRLNETHRYVGTQRVAAARVVLDAAVERAVEKSERQASIG